MSNSASMYFEEAENKAYWLEKARAYTNRSLLQKLKDFIVKLFKN
jgi:hypothetical protein